MRSQAARVPGRRARRAEGASRRGPLLRLTPTVMAGVCVVTAFSTELKFRVRPLEDTYSGVPDAQIILELVIWAVAAGLVLLGMTRERPSARNPWGLSGGCVRTLSVVFLLIGVSAVFSLSSYAMVRAAQFGLVTAIAAIVSWKGRGDPAYVGQFWSRLRWGVVGGTVLATAAMALYPGATPQVSYVGVERYRWFEMHPIGTSIVLGLAVIMLVGHYLDTRPGQSNRVMAAAGFGLVAGLAFLLWQTRTRATLGGTLVALSILIAWGPRSRRRAALVVAALVLAAGLLLLLLPEAGIEGLQAAVLRGEDTRHLLSMSDRAELFRLAAGLFLERPIFGYGYLQAGPIFTGTVPWAGESHNVVIEIMVSMGIVGLAAFAVLIGGVARRLVRAIRAPMGRDTGMAVQASAVLAYILATGMVSEGFAGSLGFQTCALMAVVVVADSLGRRSPSESR